MKGRSEVTVVGDDQDRRGAGRAGGHPCLFDEIDQDLVRGSTSRVANDQSGRDPLAAKAGVRHAVEDELDRDWRRDRPPETTDQRGLRRRAGLAREGVEQVGTVQDQAVRSAERVAGL
jgi:hypothetical protein